MCFLISQAFAAVNLDFQKQAIVRQQTKVRRV